MSVAAGLVCALAAAAAVPIRPARPVQALRRLRASPVAVAAGESAAAEPRLVGYENFVRSNPRSDRFGVLSFHHIEFVCGDAATTAARWCAALGFQPVASSSLVTGNRAHASHVIRSGALTLAFTAPYIDGPDEGSECPTLLGADGRRRPAALRDYFDRHGLSACAVALHVDDAHAAFDAAVAGGAEPVTPPRAAPGGTTPGDGLVLFSEVRLYGDVALRFVSGAPLEQGQLSFLPGYVPAVGAGTGPAATFGIRALDHCVGNVPDLLAAVRYLQRATGFHEFAEFTAEDVGTVDSGLNSMVLACNSEQVLLPLNEPTFGGRRKSQIQTYLDQHKGPGVQHLAMRTADIFATVRAMRDARGGFALMDRPREEYYAALRDRLGHDTLTQEQIDECRELGILADRDDQGVLLQIFTRPVGDRSTLFLEIIQRIGCEVQVPQIGVAEMDGAPTGGSLPGGAGTAMVAVEQTPGCGGFGKGNFHELFRAIEEYETKAGINTV